MADPHDDLTEIVDEVRRVTMLPAAQTLRDRSDQRRRRRLAVTGAGLVVLAVAAGAALVRAEDQADRVVGTASWVPPSVAPSATTSAGAQDILGGRRQVRVVVPGLNGAALAVGQDDDRVRAGAEPGIDDRTLWILRPEGNRFRIVLAAPRGGNRVCMTVVHDAAPGSVRARVCDPAAPAQLFRIERVAGGTYSMFQGRRYVQVVDGTNALVPDLPEALTTTYEFEDRGPAATR
jgi:hypothetical protein